MDELYSLRTKINMYLQEVNFVDDDLCDLSEMLNKILDNYELSKMSESDKRASDIRKAMINVSKKMNDLTNPLEMGEEGSSGEGGPMKADRLTS